MLQKKGLGYGLLSPPPSKKEKKKPRKEVRGRRKSNLYIKRPIDQIRKRLLKKGDTPVRERDLLTPPINERKGKKKEQ